MHLETQRVRVYVVANRGTERMVIMERGAGERIEIFEVELRKGWVFWSRRRGAGRDRQDYRRDAMLGTIR